MANRKLTTSFFERKAKLIAKDLVGMLLCVPSINGIVKVVILETGAYEGGNKTASRKGMLYSHGTIFIMPFRGNNFLNITTDKSGIPSCVLIRKVSLQTQKREDKKLNGPGKLTKYLNIDMKYDGVLLGEEVWIEIPKVLLSSKGKRDNDRSENCLSYFEAKT